MALSSSHTAGPKRTLEVEFDSMRRLSEECCSRGGLSYTLTYIFIKSDMKQLSTETFKLSVLLMPRYHMANIGAVCKGY